MSLMYQLFGSVIPMFTNIAILMYICQRFLAATRLRRKIMTEMRDFTMIVRRARENVRYIGEQVAKGIEEIKEDVGKELRVTDRLTTQSSKVATVLQRFAVLEDNVIELVRMERNRESVRIETPADVKEEIENVLVAAERKKRKEEEGAWKQEEEVVELSEESKRKSDRKSEGGSIGAPRWEATQRTPLSKFSACGPRETRPLPRKPTDGRPRISTMPEVRLLGEQPKP